MNRETETRPKFVEARVASETAGVALTGLLAWAIPGLGHWFLGQRSRAIVFFITTTVTFWAGVAVGGVKSTVNPKENGAWFAAQLCMGGQTLAAWGAGEIIKRAHPSDIAYDAYWPADTISVVYTGITGLLNLLIIVDALARAESGPVQLLSRPPPGGG